MSSVGSAVFLNDQCFVQGGASRIAIDEAVGLAERGIRVTFLGATGPVGPELEASRVETICLDQPERLDGSSRPGVALQGWWNGRAARRMRTLLTPLDQTRTIEPLHSSTPALTPRPLRADRLPGAM